MRHVARLDLAQLEDPSVHDGLERARQNATTRMGLIVQFLGLGQDALTLATLAAAIALYSPLLLLLLLVAVIPGLIGESHVAALQYSLHYHRTPQRRRLDYLRLVATSEQTAREVQLFGLSEWLVARFERLSGRLMAENRRLAVRRSLVAGLLSLLGLLSYYGAYVLIIAEAVSGAISLGTLILLAGAFARSRDVLAQFRTGAAAMIGQALHLRDLFDFLAIRPGIASKPGAPAVPQPIARGIEFQNVGFRYPGSSGWALRDVSFTLAPGERIALVGENGAGKTTITKLFARLYDPTEGRIVLDGRDLRDYDLASLRAAIGVIFQDFVRYQLRFEENIGVGQLDVLGPDDEDGTASLPGAEARGDGVAEAIRAAARKSLADTILPRLPGGYRQLLGRWFEEGVGLSGGEWQKVALARAYVRECQLLILDEPTAALDARTEYEVFRRFSELAAGRTAVLISHRFSTVRMAQRILVLDQGAIAEQGSHDSLVERGGAYAKLFALQAEGYR
jgi:ATP-binding cassette subfamily B protein